ncbi:MAG TPA: ABC transporter ATP-binding protein, partial [Armatimonadota bacterium]
MTVIQRLTKFAKPYLGNLYTGVCLTAISTFLETAVVSALIASMVALVTGDQSPAASAKTNIPSLPVAPGLSERLVALKSQLLAYLSHFCGGSDPSKIQQLIILALLTVFVVLLKCGFFSRASYLMHRFAQLMSRDLRGRLFAHLVRQPPAYYETERTGAQLTRITSDVVMLQQNLGPELIQVLQAPLTIIISLSIMAWLSWQLMLSVLCLAPLIALVMGIAGKKIRKIAVSMQERLGDLNAGLLERLANIRVVQSFVRERYEIDHVARFNDRYYRETMKSVLVSETLAPSVEFIAWVGMVLGVILGGTQVLSHRMDANSFLYFMFVAQRAGSQFKALSRINQIRQIINGAGERILGTLDVVPEIQDRPNAVTLPHITGNVVFDHLHFGYRSGGDVLSDINLQVEPGEVIALVGPSGSGKTTLVNLLPRFYDPIQGRILIDGHDIRDVSLDSLREQVGIVPQETLLFSGSIYENILYGR